MDHRADARYRIAAAAASSCGRQRCTAHAPTWKEKRPMTTTSRRGSLRLLAALAAATLATLATLATTTAPSIARAQASGTVRIIVPLGPGSGADNTSRFLAPKLSAALGQPVVVENRPGGDMLLAVQALLSAPPDGQTLLMITPSSVVINPVVMKDLPYDPQRDIRPVIALTRGESLLVTAATAKTRTLAEALEAARTKPGAVSVANYGHYYRLGAIQLQQKAGVEFTHVAYKGAAQSANDVIGGNVDLALTDLGGSLPLIRSGKLRPLATTGVRRHGDLPDVPTIAESGFPGYQQYVWIGFGVHGRTPDAAAQRIESALQSVIAQPDYKAFVVANGNAEIIGLDGRQTAAMIASEIARYRELVRSLESGTR